MTWPVVCAFAAIIGIYVGVINQIPILYDTSFRDIAVTYEWWVLFAVLIVSNCKSAREAGMKCLVFFLISQPVIFLVELPSIGLDKVLYYYTKIWLPITLLTLPGGAIAFYAKKAKRVGRSCSSIGNTVVALLGVSYFQKALSFFPAASADGRFLCCDHCRSSYGGCSRSGRQDFVGGYDSTADGRRYYWGCAQ